MTTANSTCPVVPFFSTESAGFRTARYAIPLEQIPADFFADRPAPSRLMTCLLGSGSDRVRRRLPILLRSGSSR